MIDLVSHPPGIMQGSDPPPSIAMPRTTALTATVTSPTPSQAASA